MNNYGHSAIAATRLHRRSLVCEWRGSNTVISEQCQKSVRKMRVTLFGTTFWNTLLIATTPSRVKVQKHSPKDSDKADLHIWHWPWLFLLRSHPASATNGHKCQCYTTVLCALLIKSQSRSKQTRSPGCWQHDSCRACFENMAFRSHPQSHVSMWFGVIYFLDSIKACVFIYGKRNREKDQTPFSELLWF